MTEQDLRRAELAPQRYGGIILGTLMLLGAVVVARAERSWLAAADQFFVAVVLFGWSWRAWILSPRQPQDKAGSPTD